MLIQRGSHTYVYSSQRVNGKRVTRYIGRSTSAPAQAYQRQRDESRQRKDDEDALAQLQSAVARAMDMLHLMIRGHLLLAGYFERKSEIRKLQEDHCV
jgi:hypothetical protein